MPISTQIHYPFDDYRWQWASLMPQESLKKPETFLSVLRVMMRYEGLPYTQEPTKEELLQDFEDIGIQRPDGDPMKVRRNDGTNVLIRNDQPYWTTLGCLVPTQLSGSTIKITSLGNALALGRISLQEFGELICQRLQLPNPAILFREETYEEWVKYGVAIRPLALILKVLVILYRRGGLAGAYLAQEELAAIIIPMAPKYGPDEIADAIEGVRSGTLDPSFFPSRSITSADGKEMRVAREFLQFLAIVGIAIFSRRNVRHIDKKNESEWCTVNTSLTNSYTLNILTKNWFGEDWEADQVLNHYDTLATEALKSPFVSRSAGEEYDSFRLHYSLEHLGKYEHEGRSVSHIRDRAIKDYAKVLRQKKQVIFYGPPGTGKTRLAMEVRDYITGPDWEERSCIVQFHQSYSYEDFIESIRPRLAGAQEGAMEFEYRNGAFKELCLKAMRKENQDKEYVIVIDEINRGNISSIFGELIMLLEETYRSPDHAVKLPYTREAFYIPKNVFLIGTMNSADKSAIDIDIALRRRFHFIRLDPDIEVLSRELTAASCSNISSDDKKYSIQPVKVLSGINKLIISDRNLGRDYALGQSFFLPRDGNLTLGDLVETLRGTVIPLLEEYLLISPKFRQSLEAIGMKFQGSYIQADNDTTIMEYLNRFASIIEG